MLENSLYKKTTAYCDNKKCSYTDEHDRLQVLSITVGNFVVVTDRQFKCILLFSTALSLSQLKFQVSYNSFLNCQLVHAVLDNLRSHFMIFSYFFLFIEDWQNALVFYKLCYKRYMEKDKNYVAAAKKNHLKMIGLLLKS